jgi:nuclear transport factor 2 (NTF2) superfamily protein
VIDRPAAEEWVSAYAQAWRDRDPEAAARLFSENAAYYSHPLRDPHQGRTGVAEYWRRATSDQSDIRLRFGRPMVDGDHVAVEWWAEMSDDSGDVTIPGCLVLLFDDGGTCAGLREYWHQEPGRHAPYGGWGE